MKLQVLKASTICVLSSAGEAAWEQDCMGSPCSLSLRMSAEGLSWLFFFREIGGGSLLNSNSSLTICAKQC